MTIEETNERCFNVAWQTVKQYASNSNLKIREAEIKLSLPKTDQIHTMFVFDSKKLFSLYIDRYIEELKNLSPNGPYTISIKNCLINFPEAYENHTGDLCFLNCKIESFLKFRGMISNSFAKRISSDGDVIVTNSVIGDLESKGLVITNSTIENININQCYRLFVKNSAVDTVSVRSCTFLFGAILSDVSFQRIELFENSVFKSKNVNFRNVTFEDVSTDKSLGIYRSVKAACHEADYEHGVILFHGLELETYYNVQLKGNTDSSILPEKISSLLHKRFTDYGRNTILPIYWLMAFLIIFIPINYMMGTELAAAVLLSLKSSLGPLSFALSGEKWLNLKPQGIWDGLINAIHIILSSILWFLVIFMIRRRFKI